MSFEDLPASVYLDYLQHSLSKFIDGLLVSRLYALHFFIMMEDQKIFHPIAIPLHSFRNLSSDVISMDPLVSQTHLIPFRKVPIKIDD
jgi:hypothetical protein